MVLWPRVSCGIVTATLISACLVSSGCAGSKMYSTPGQAADFRALGITQEQADQLTDSGIARKLERKPLAAFPAHIAVARVQGQGYASQTAVGYGSGRFSIVTTHDVEPETAFDKLKSLPMVGGVASLNRIVMPTCINTEQDLRAAAASIQADMLLIYTFDTSFATDKERFVPLALISLGLFPDRQARVSSTASAALIDTRNGYVYGLAEATGEERQVANAWSNCSAIDRSRRKAETLAFQKLQLELESLWRDVAKRYGPRA